MSRCRLRESVHSFGQHGAIGASGAQRSKNRGDGMRMLRAATTAATDTNDATGQPKGRSGAVRLRVGHRSSGAENRKAHRPTTASTCPTPHFSGRWRIPLSPTRVFVNESPMPAERLARWWRDG